MHGSHVSEQEVLLAALEARDPGTSRHTRGVIDLSERVAIRLGLPDKGVAEVAQVAALHDIGKLATPDAILNKTGVLDESERAIMQAHTILGGELLGCIPSLAHLERPVRATHERWDGTGYPDRLARTMIPLASRIVFVCDAYDAMMTDAAVLPGERFAEHASELLDDRQVEFLHVHFAGPGCFAFRVDRA